MTTGEIEVNLVMYGLSEAVRAKDISAGYINTSKIVY